jgi:hypothetical protein
MLHETRAYICWEAKRIDAYRFSLAETERWYRPTGTPALIAKCERLADISQTTKLQLPKPKLSKDVPTVTAADDPDTAELTVRARGSQL